ncbi:MAG TPA: MFS transporter [Rhodomicrobium sp.]|nr:MFS transporter [Rhodomicrobium sp.]
MTMPAKEARNSLEKSGLSGMAARREPFFVSRAERRRVIAASSVGTVFEWYDFYLYAVLAPFFARLFFPPENETAALLAAFATYAAGFIVRPFGAVFFGRLGDLTGRKYTFLISIIFMGFSTFTVGLLPVFEEVGWLAPILLVTLRLLQGLALGGEYGGAATYVAEYNPARRRGYATSWIQTTATSGLLLALIVIGVCRWQLTAANFERWGWRIPFLFSILLLAFSIYIRIRLRETPVFLRMKAEGRSSEIPVWESFFRSPNNKYIILSLLGATAGQGVVWYTGQFYTLFFLTMTLHLDYLTAYLIVGATLAAGTPFFIFFGWLSDKIGRLKIILAGCLLAATSYFPLFQHLSNAINPALVEFQAANPITLRVDRATCNVHIFVGPWSSFSLCDQVTDFLTKSGLSFTKLSAPGSRSVSVSIGGQTVEISAKNEGGISAVLKRALFAAGYPGLTWKYANGEPQADVRGDPLFEQRPANPARIDYRTALGVLFALMLYATMVYGPIAAFLVELFPPKVRYTSLSFPYHIGNGVFGGMLPLLATAIVAATGDVYAGLWYPVSVAGVTCVIGALFLRKRRCQEQ